MKVTREEIAQVLEMDLSDPGKIERSNAGVFTIRKEYYWRPKRTEEESFAPQLAKLRATFEVTDVEYGDKYTSFKGGEGVKRNSHYWMKFRATKQEVAISK